MPGQEAEEFTTGNANGLTPRFYNGFRWYRPLLGRYTQADSLDYNAGLFNLYGYAENNPIYDNDALGLVAPAPGVYGGYHDIVIPGTNITIPNIGHEFYTIVNPDGSVTTVSGEPVNAKLISQPGADSPSDTIIDPQNLIPITPPGDMNTSQLGQDLINAGSNYNANSSENYDYNLIYENSNSFYQGIGNALGISLPSHGATIFPGDAWPIQLFNFENFGDFGNSGGFGGFGGGSGFGGFGSSGNSNSPGC
jgi:RHS repeat-associated protein